MLAAQRGQKRSRGSRLPTARLQKVPLSDAELAKRARRRVMTGRLAVAEALGRLLGVVGRRALGRARAYELLEEGERLIWTRISPARGRSSAL